MSVTDMESGQEVVSLNDLIAAGVSARFAEAGYVNDDGVKDYAPLVEKLTDLVLTARVPSGKEKADRAIQRERFVRETFPALPGPEAIQALDPSDRELAEKVYERIDRKVWELLKSDASGEVQQAVGIRVPGLLVCKTKIGGPGNRLDYAYVTDDLACIKADFNAPLAKKVMRANLLMAVNMNMAMGRLPQHAAKFERAYESANKTALETGRTAMRPGIDAAKDSSSGDES